jgi:hypothetical protein
MFIDQLAMIQEKTRGNLTSEESTVLRNALSNLQMAYVEVAQKTSGVATPAPGVKPEQQPASTEKTTQGESKTSEPISTSVPGESESKKKFTKSYGP